MDPQANPTPEQPQNGAAPTPPRQDAPQTAAPATPEQAPIQMPQPVQPIPPLDATPTSTIDQQPQTEPNSMQNQTTGVQQHKGRNVILLIVVAVVLLAGLGVTAYYLFFK